VKRRGSDALRGLAEDLRDHLEREIEDNIARGMPPEDARRQALLTFGNPTLIAEDTRAVWVWRWAEDLPRDLSYAWRSFRRVPAFSAAAVLTLGLGVAALTVITSIVYGVLYRPLPFANADRLVRIVQVLRMNGAVSRSGLRPGQIASWQAHSRTLAVGYYQPISLNLTDVPAPIRLTGAAITPALLRGVAVAPLAGRLFTDDDAVPGNTHVVLLAERTWNREFGADPALVGRTVTLNTEPYRVVGIMPDGFEFPSVAAPSTTDSTGALADAPELWTPLPALDEQPFRKGGFSLVRNTFGLLRSGATLAQARAEVSALLPLQPDRRLPIELVNVRVEQARTVRPILLIFEAAVVFVLFIACANVTNLLLARGVARQRELAVRLSLGAGRLRLLRQSIAEGLVIGAVGACAGAALTWAGITAFRRLPPYLLPRMHEVRIDAATVAFAVGTSVLAGVLVSAAAAHRSSRGASNLLLGGSPGPSSTASQAPLRVLVMAQVAAGLVLFTGAALLFSSLVHLTRVDPGFDPDDVFSFEVSLPSDRYAPAAAAAFARRLASELEALPGVSGVSVGDAALGRDSIGFSPDIDGQPRQGAVAFRSVDSGFFETLGIQIERGRAFDTIDASASPQAAIVNRTFAARYFPGGDPIGHRVSLQDWHDLTIVGIAGDVRAARPDAAVEAQLYVPANPALAQPAGLTFFLRTTAAPPLLGRDIRARVGGIDPELVVYHDGSLAATLERTYADAKAYGLTSMTFALVAVTLAAIGLYGVLAFTVSARTRELGVRIAIGASRARVIWLVLRDAIATVLLGIVLGLGAAWYVSRFLRTWLYGVTVHDPSIYAAVALLFLVVGALAAYVPARRATKVDPAVALRID
jgi:putative ABC transport system permease protein